MLFSSITFIGFFLPVVLALYFVAPQRTYRNAILLIASLLFYMWGEPKFVFLMVASVLFNYVMGILIANRPLKSLLFLAVAVDIGILFIFKYLGFSCIILNHLISFLHLNPIAVVDLALPIGISFYTFQQITYLVDVYRNPQLVQRNILNLGLYVVFFPQLIAGPIVRYHDIRLQISERRESLDGACLGFQRFIIGLAKKVLIANNMALVCDTIYGADPLSYGAAAAWIAAIAYTLQIFYDFSGYSDMAIGLAKIFGFNLLENFNYPYAANSVTDFWRRWHISLTNFFRDYVYISLGGNRCGERRTAVNRGTVFFLTGLWHGAAFNFILWGLLHGAAMTVERALKLNDIKNSVGRQLYRIVTLFLIVMLWVLFRNGTIDGLHLWQKMLGISGLHTANTNLWLFFVDCKFYIILAVAVLFAFPWWRGIKLNVGAALPRMVSVLKGVALIFLLLLCMANLANGTYNPFIYFRF